MGTVAERIYLYKDDELVTLASLTKELGKYIEDNSK